MSKILRLKPAFIYDWLFSNSQIFKVTNDKNQDVEEVKNSDRLS